MITEVSVDFADGGVSVIEVEVEVLAHITIPMLQARFPYDTVTDFEIEGA